MQTIKISTANEEAEGPCNQPKLDKQPSEAGTEQPAETGKITMKLGTRQPAKAGKNEPKQVKNYHV